MIVWFLSVIGCPTRNERHATFALARHGTLTGRLGKFPSHSCLSPPPPPPPTPTPAVISSSWPGGAILLAAGPAQFPMYLRCHAWIVFPNGSYLFIPAATQAYGMFSSQLTCFFSQPRRSVRLIWGPLIPAKVDQTRQIFEPSLDAPLPPPTFSHLLRFIWFCTCKRKKKKKELCCSAALKRLHGRYTRQNLFDVEQICYRKIFFFFFSGVGGKCKVSLASVEIFPCCILPMWGRRSLTSSQPPKTEAENIPVDPLWAIWVITGAAKGNRSFSSLFEIKFQLWNISPCASTCLHPAGGRLEGPQHFTRFRHQSSLLFAC